MNVIVNLETATYCKNNSFSYFHSIHPSLLGLPLLHLTAEDGDTALIHNAQDAVAWMAGRGACTVTVVNPEP